MSKKRLVVIDGKSVFYRGYYAMPNLATKEGTPTGGVYGFAVMALEVIKKMNPDYVCVAWDKPKTNIRRRTEIYPEYKANRKPAPPDFYEQIPLLHELLDAFGWPLYEIDDHEADDIMGTFAKQAEAKGFESVLITGDHDVLQLVDEDTTVAILKKGLTNIDMFNPELFKKRYQMTPEQFIDYKSLRGDPSDNIPGVRGVGEKTAIQLINEYKTLDGVFEHVDELKGTLKTKVTEDKENAYIAQKLVTLDTDVPLKLEWDKADVVKMQPKDIVQVLRKLEFRALLNQLPEHIKTAIDEIPEAKDSIELGKDVHVTNVTTEATLKKMKLHPSGRVMVHTWNSGAAGKDMTEILISDNAKNAYFVSLSKELDGEVVAGHIGPILSDPKVDVIAYNTKDVIKAFARIGVHVTPVGHDVRMAAFLINSLIREQSLSRLALNELGYEGEDLDDIPPEDRLSLAGKITSAVWALYKLQMDTMRKDMPKVFSLAQKVEWPVIEVLAKMELEGMWLDVAYLKKMSKELEGYISDVEQEIYGYADSEFNISSPAQLSEVLFEKMGLPTEGIKKTKTAYSTAASELDKLRGESPIIDLISKYREDTKLKSTYVDALPGLVDDEGKLHTTFSMAVAPTGRLSSHDPNLQNIPVRSEMGKKIRRAFNARDGYVFIAADYSQFELRLAAVLSGDDDMIKAFNDGQDIHTLTAAQAYGLKPEEVTKDQRRDAKVINFGILYGMSPHGLSVATGMTPKEAKAFIDRYFELRKPLLAYIDESKKKAKENGYVETMFGRRRPTPDVNSSNFIVRQAAERAAFNHPIQGTEADLMKMAMIKIDEMLPDDAYQVLQIHDSIMIEAPQAKAEDLAKQSKEIMEHIYELPVNLDVDVSIAKNWGDL